MSLSDRAVVNSQPVWQLAFAGERQAAPTGPLAELKPSAVALPPPAPSTEQHLAAAVPSAKYLSGIEAYATGKDGVGFFAWRFWKRRSQAKEYLRESGVDLAKVMPKMPWNASRSLCVLALLVAKGLKADQIHAIFEGKDKVERGELNLFLSAGRLSAEDVVSLMTCKTPTFLKKVTTLAAIEGDGKLIVDATTTDEVKDAAIGRLVRLAQDGSGYENAARDLLENCLLDEDVPLRPALAEYVLSNANKYLDSLEPEDIARGLMHLIQILKKGDEAQRQAACTLALRRQTYLAGFLDAGHAGIKNNNLYLLCLLLENGSDEQKKAVGDLAVREKAQLEAILGEAEEGLLVKILAFLCMALANSGDRQELKVAMSQIVLDSGRLPALLSVESEDIQANALLLLTDVIENSSLAQWWTVLRLVQACRPRIEHLRDRSRNEDVQANAADLLRAYEEAAKRHQDHQPSV